jgi:hypothetical protein
MTPPQLGLVIKGIQMTAGTGTKNHEDSSSRCRLVRRPISKRMSCIYLRPNWGPATDRAQRLIGRPQQTLLRQQSGTRDAAERLHRIAQKTTPIK